MFCFVTSSSTPAATGRLFSSSHRADVSRGAHAGLRRCVQRLMLAEPKVCYLQDWRRWLTLALALRSMLQLDQGVLQLEVCGTTPHNQAGRHWVSRTATESGRRHDSAWPGETARGVCVRRSTRAVASSRSTQSCEVCATWAQGSRGTKTAPRWATPFSWQY
jgi:hypothetical protein